MSMLAEPRQKRGYHLAPRGKPLYEDENRFGTKMLKKMGWSMGKGLGANEDGSKDFVRVRYKNNNIGVGYEDRDDQWKQHDNDFSGLLKSLNNSEQNSDEETSVQCSFKTEVDQNDETKSKLFSGESLEEKSKKSKVRVHYKKFTRGKDLSQYSEKDLANIFGKKSKVVEIEEDRATSISTGVSVNDYFKNKMEKIKKKKNLTTTDSMVTGENVELFNEKSAPEAATLNEKKHKASELEGQIEDLKEVEDNSVNSITKKKNKRKRKEEKDEEIVNNNSEIVENIKIPRKKKQTQEGEDQQPLLSFDETIKEKKNKSKKKNKTINDDLPENTFQSKTDGKKSEKSKKEKKAHKDTGTGSNVIQSSQFSSSAEDENKLKHSNNKNETVINNNLEVDNIFTISTFCAEKFRQTALDQFVGSNIAEIIGYGVSEDVQLNIVESKEDTDKILKFWNAAVDKYANKKAATQRYFDKVNTARKLKKGIPKIHVKQFKRKNAFKCL